MAKSKCFFCGEKLVEGSVGTYKLIQGWVPIRIDGGSNTVALASDPMEWAHGNCIDRKRYALKNRPQQKETLF